nr:hypothetical protein Q903MT_gene2603 [Picea sitchensis]
MFFGLTSMKEPDSETNGMSSLKQPEGRESDHELPNLHTRQISCWDTCSQFQTCSLVNQEIHFVWSPSK